MVGFNKVIIIFVLLISFCVFNNSIIAADTTTTNIRDGIIKVCENKYEKNSSDLYYCILSQFYAFERVLDIMNKYKKLEDVKKIDKLLRKHDNKKYNNFNFVEIERDFNNYLKEKERNL